MKKITAKYITENIERMQYGEKITHDGCTYWMNNDIIYVMSEDRKISGAINGVKYAVVVNGIAYLD